MQQQLLISNVDESNIVGASVDMSDLNSNLEKLEEVWPKAGPSRKTKKKK